MGGLISLQSFSSPKWLDDDGILENIKMLVKASQSIRQTKHKSIAEILYVCDEPSLFYAPPPNITDSKTTMRNWQLAGAPIDYVLTEDLFEADLSDVKAIIFSSCYMYDKKIIQKIKTLAPDCTFIWQGEKPKIQFGCKNDVFAPLGITVKSTRKIQKDARVHFYAPEQCAIYADNRMISYFPREDMEFISQFKNVCSVKNISYVEITQNQNTIKLSLNAKSGVAFEIMQYDINHNHPSSR